MIQVLDIKMSNLSPEICSRISKVSEIYLPALIKTLYKLSPDDRDEYLNIFFDKGAYHLLNSDNQMFDFGGYTRDYFYLPSTLQEYRQIQKYHYISEIPHKIIEREFPWGGFVHHRSYEVEFYPLPDEDKQKRERDMDQLLERALALDSKMDLDTFEKLTYGRSR